MRTENLEQACNSFESFFGVLRESHTDAVNSDNQFAEIALSSLIESAAKMQTKLARVRDAAAADAAQRKALK